MQYYATTENVMRTVNEIYQKTLAKDTFKTSNEIQFNFTSALKSLINEPLFKHKGEKQ